MLGVPHSKVRVRLVNISASGSLMKADPADCVRRRLRIQVAGDTYGSCANRAGAAFSGPGTRGTSARSPVDNAAGGAVLLRAVRPVRQTLSQQGWTAVHVAAVIAGFGSREIWFAPVRHLERARANRGTPVVTNLLEQLCASPCGGWSSAVGPARTR